MKVLVLRYMYVKNISAPQKLDFYKNAQLSPEPERGHLESNSAIFGWYSDEK